MNYFEKFIYNRIKPASHIISAITLRGGVCYLVGGAVRDLFLFEKNKNRNFYSIDLDIEVFGLDLSVVQNILESFTFTIFVGKQFGILKTPKLNIDWGLPRADSMGRRPEVVIDKNLSLQQALARRDVTINSMALNLSKIIADLDTILKNVARYLEDPFCGLTHLRGRQIHPTSVDKFGEDPLRLFRVMQFCSRFNFTPSKQLDLVVVNMPFSRTDKTSLFYVAKERVTKELEKMFLLSSDPLSGIIWLNNLHLLGKAFFNDQKLVFDRRVLLKASKNCRSFLKLSCKFRVTKLFSEEDIFVGLLSLLLLGIKNQRLIRSFFDGLSVSKEDQALVLALINLLDQNKDFSVFELKCIAKKIYPLPLLFFLVLQRSLGQIPKKTFRNTILFAKKRHFLLQPISPLLTGRDLIADLAPGPLFKKILDEAYLYQLQNNIQSKLKMKIWLNQRS